MKIPIQKLKAILLFFGMNTNPSLLGKVKLMKLFYFIDFEHVRQYGSPITFDRYINLEYGPIPSTIKNLVDGVEDYKEDSKLKDVISIEADDSGLKKVISKRKFEEKDKQYFTESELKVMHEIANRFAGSTKKEIEDASHKEIPWSSTNFLDIIPYSLAVKDEEEKKAIDIAMELVGCWLYAQDTSKLWWNFFYNGKEYVYLVQIDEILYVALIIDQKFGNELNRLHDIQSLNWDIGAIYNPKANFCSMFHNRRYATLNSHLDLMSQFA